VAFEEEAIFNGVMDVLRSGYPIKIVGMI